MTSRTAAERLTKREWQNLAEELEGLCGCECGGRFAEKVDGVWVKIAPCEDEHTIPNAIKKGKPDNIMLTGCHAKKTPVDVARCAKARRQARETGQQKRRAERECSPWPSRPLKSRGFQKPPKGYTYRWGKCR